MHRKRQLVRMTPRAYLIPLHTDGQPVRAHLLAFGCHGSDQQVQAELQLLVEGHGLAWRPPERLPVDGRKGTVRLPPTIFLHQALSRERWFRPSAIQDFATKNLRRAFVVGTPSVRWFLDPRDLADGDAMWREGRHATLVADLDSARLSQAANLVWRSVPLALRSVSGYEASIERGRALEWDMSVGAFRTPPASRARWRAERAAAQDAFVRDGRHLFHPKRWRFLYAELENRARQRSEPGQPGRPEDELRDEVQRGFADIDLLGGVRQFLASVGRRARARPDRPVEAVTSALPKAYQAMVSEVRRSLAAYLEAAIRPGRRRQHESSHEFTETDLQVPAPGVGGAESARLMDRAPDLLAEQDFLERIIAEEMSDRVQRILTPAERELFDAYVLRGEPLKEYAKRTGRQLATVYVQKSRLERKAKGLLGSA